MNNKRVSLNERGMGALEMLLILIIIAILAFIGWYVYDSNKKANNSYSNANQSNSSQTTTKKKKPAAKTFTFKEYGVKITLPDSLKDLSYTAKQVDNGDGTKVTDLFLNYPSLAKAIDDCNTTKGSDGNFAALSKGDGKFPANPTPDIGGLLKQFDKFYVSVSYPNGIPCSDSTKEDAVVAQMQALQKELVTAFKDTATLV